VTPEEVRQYYDQNQAQFQKRDERQASHILIAADAKASPQAKAAARAKAEQILKQVRAKPASFGELARKESQDPGSASRGGDLGYGPRGAMVKPFDDAVWSMKPGEIAGPIETEYGYHIVRLDNVRGRGFDDVKGQIEADLRRQKSAKRVAEVAEQLSNTAFEQSDSLKPAAEAVKLPLRQSGWVTRAGGGEKPFDNPKLLSAAFSDEVIKDKRNSEVVDLGENTLAVARVLEHKPASVRPFDAVSGEITKRLTRERGAELAAKDGREQLAKVQQGQDAGVKWTPAQTITRGEPKGLPVSVVAQAFRTDAGKLPAYAGAEDGRGGYALVRVTKVVEPPAAAPEKSRAVAQQLAQLLAQEELGAAVTSFEQKAGVKIDKDRLERKQ
jgi:peptidyl-prolyl cis-trans isomerase D